MTHATNIDAVVESTRAIFELDDNSSADSQLVRDYGRFKLGEVSARNWFLDETARTVWSKLADSLKSCAADWIIVTPATTELARDFSTRLACKAGRAEPIPVLVAGPDPHPESDYTGCSFEERLQIVDTFYDFNADLRGTRVLIVDDFVNTGTALRALVQRLCRCGADLGRIKSFVFVRGRFAEPQRERELVTSVIAQMKLVDILNILNHPEHYVTSATMLKYLAGRSQEDLERVKAELPISRLDVLRRGLLNYYRNHPMPQHLAVLAKSGQNDEN